MKFISKQAPKIENNQILTLSKDAYYSLVTNYLLQDSKLKLLNIEKDINGNFTLTEEEIKELYKHCDELIDAKVITTVNGRKVETATPLKIDTNGNINTVYIRKNGTIKKGQLYIRKNNEIRKAIIYKKEKGRLIRGI